MKIFFNFFTVMDSIHKNQAEEILPYQFQPEIGKNAETSVS